MHTHLRHCHILSNFHHLQIEIEVNAQYNFTRMKLLIYEARSKLGWSGLRLSRETGIPKSTLYRYENNKGFPNLKQIEAIAKALHIRITDLFESDYK